MGAASAAKNETRGTLLAERLEIATSLWARFMGLMGRSAIETDGGLWLSGTNGIHMFFMRFPIDAVFLGRAGADGRRRVLSVHHRVRPWVGMIPLVRGADGVLELPVGTIDRTMTAVGDVIVIG
jgi:uncharacterized membrane protein (UPF0127 family)